MEKGEESLLSNIEAHLFSNPSLALISISPNATSSWKETERKYYPVLQYSVFSNSVMFITQA